MLSHVLMVSLTMSAVIVLLLLISPCLRQRYSAKWCYLIWLVLALRLIIPWRFELPDAPLNIPAPPEQAIMLQQDGRLGLVIGNGSDSATVPASAPTSAIALTDNAPVITLQELLFVVWALGAVSFFLFHMISYMRFRRKIRPYCKAEPAAPDSVFESVLLDLNIKGRPQLSRCSQIASPMLTGFFRPVILLPDLEYTREEWSVVLRHELTHYKRGDIWYKLILLAANSVHWFNPLVYFMVKAANRDLEYSCDDIVVKNSDLNFRKRYSLAILKTMQNQEPPALSTGLSANGENARIRFANILDGKNKKRGIWALVFVLALAGLSGAMVACSNGQESTADLPGSHVEKLYQYQRTDAGDEATVGAMVRALHFTDLPVKSIAFKTDGPPYEITVDYQVGSRVDYRFQKDIFTELSRTAAVMLSLIPKAGVISIGLHDDYGWFYGVSYHRESLSTYYGMEYFTADRVNEAADSLESFTNYLDKVSALRNAEEFYNEDKLILKQNEERTKQIYAVIGDDRELIATSYITNNPMNFQGTITDAVAVSPEIQKLAEQNDLLAQYKDKEITFLVLTSNNFKIGGPYIHYLFAFDGEKVIAYTEV